jgi:hypothetical protein
MRGYVLAAKLVRTRGFCKEVLAKKFGVEQHEAHEALVQLNREGLVSQAKRTRGCHCCNEWTRDWYAVRYDGEAVP